MLINPQEFVLDIPDLHPLSSDYTNFWRTQYKRCIEGHWLGGYYMPPGLYFYVNFGTILLNKKRANVKSVGRPWLRDLEWAFFQHWLEARGFSGFDKDNEFSGNFLLLDPSYDDEFFKYFYPSVFREDGTRKEFKHPRTLLQMQHTYHKGAPLYENEAYNMLMLGSRDTGKALSDDSILYTKEGKITIGNSKVGDAIFDESGHLTTITGVYPQGELQLYKITFRDGRSVEACENHIWKVYKKNKLVTLQTKDLIDSLYSNRSVSYKNRKGKEANYFLPKTSPVEYKEKNLPLDPYTLGVLLGDGSLTQNIGFSSADAEILEYIPYTVSKLQAEYAYSVNGLSSIIKDLKLKCKSEHKFIPEVYKHSSIEQRFELLRGLMDTDGCANKDGTIEFSSSSEKLANDTLELARSLGIIGSIRKRKTKRKDNYRVYLLTSAPIFKLKRKLANLKHKKTHEKVAIVSIEKSRIAKATCITVDNESKLFLTNDYIPTHNTYMVGIGVVLHQWLFNGLTSLRPDSDSLTDKLQVADITVGAELAHYSTNMLVKTKFALENLPGSKTVNGRLYPSPFSQNYKGSWSAGSKLEIGTKRKVPGGWEDVGSGATIRHRTFRDNPFAEQGTRPIAIIVEEAGHCSNLKDIYSNTKDNLRSGLRKTGTFMMLGTGGDMESGTLDAHEMFYEPEAYDILPFPDTWEQRGNIGFFVPAYMALNEYKDDQGFSRIEDATKALLKAREKAKTGSGGSEALNKEIQYRPIVPSEIFLSKNSNVFPTAEIRRRLTELTQTDELDLLEKKVQLYFDPESPFNGVNYHIEEKAIAINKFPWNSEAVEGCPIIYEFPYMIEGNVPPGAYIIGCDPFRDNTGQGGSFAAIYVIKTSKYASTVGHDQLVATYVGRPYQGVNAVNEILYKLSLFYGNAKIYFENAVGNVKDYFEKIHRLDLLATQPVNIFNKKASYNTNETLIYGYPMSNDKIKWEALQYLRSWLLQERSNGKRNVDLLPDRFLLQQLLMFNLDGNFDGVMGFIGCILGLEEMYISSKRSFENLNKQSALDVEIDKLLINNKRLFFNIDEELSKTKTFF